MSKFLFKNLNNLNKIRSRASLSLDSSQTHNLFSFFLQSHHFSSSLSSLSVESIEKSLKKTAFTVDYLINSCGLTPKRALSASKQIKFKRSEKPNSVLTFFEENGFTQTQISKLINDLPCVLGSSPEKTLFPKLEFFRSKGFSDSDIAEIICRWPNVLRRSLENQIIPSFNLFSDLLQSDVSKNNITAFKRCVGVLLFDLEKHGVANIDILKKTGVPSRNIGYLLANQPRVFMTDVNNFRKIVEKVAKIGFFPDNITFIVAIHALRSMTKSTWDRKVEVYKKWGWSEDDIFIAFRKHAWCMVTSEDKINLIMEFWVNKMGQSSTLLVFNPKIISYSLEKRIKPRCEVYKFLVTNGLLNPDNISIVPLLYLPENRFLEKSVNPYKEEAPDVLKVYKQELDLSM